MVFRYKPYAEGDFNSKIRLEALEINSDKPFETNFHIENSPQGEGFSR